MLHVRLLCKLPNVTVENSTQKYALEIPCGYILRPHHAGVSQTLLSYQSVAARYSLVQLLCVETS